MIKLQLFVIVAAIVFAVATFSNDVLAKEKNTEHTFKLSENEKPANAQLSQLSILIGSWQGEGFGSRFEEVWNPASAGTMVGMFKVFDEENLDSDKTTGSKNSAAVHFYELMLIEQVAESVELKVKHFSADFSAWESKEDYVSFPLVSIEEGAIHFEGLSFYTLDESTLHAYIAIGQKDGSIKEELLVYNKVPGEH